MPDTINVPLLGQMNKKVALATAGAGIAVSGFLIWRQEKNKSQAAGAAASTTIAPNASGYGYGSQVPYGGESGYGYGAYGEFSAYPQEEIYGYGAYGYGYYNPYTGQYYGTGATGTGETTEGTTPASNAQWEQDVISILSGEGYSATAIQQALGVYLNGGPYTGWNSQDQTILNAAIGVMGEPPDPPSTEPPGIGTSTSASTAVKPSHAPGKFKVSQTSDSSVRVTWGPLANATSYTFAISPAPEDGGVTGSHNIGARTEYNVGNLKPGTKYTVKVAGVSSAGTGPTGTTTFKKSK